METAMETTNIPGLDREASRIGLGTWAMGGWLWGGAEDETSISTVLAALERGVNVIDTAPIYGFGRSEEVVGRALARYGQRDEVIIATKVGLEWSADGSIRRNSSRARIVQECEDTLRRLGTDYIDIYQVHWPDASTSVEETAWAMAELRRQGKIRAIGVSNYSPRQMDIFRTVAPLHVCQPPLNLFERATELYVLPYAKSQGVATLTYGTLCRGLLSGRMTAKTTFGGDDLRKDDPKFQPPRYARYLAAVRALGALARERYGKTALELAVRWVLDRPGVTVALWGARRPDQLDAVGDAMGWTLDAEGTRAVERILAEHVASPVGPEFMAPPQASAERPSAE